MGPRRRRTTWIKRKVEAGTYVWQVERGSWHSFPYVKPLKRERLCGGHVITRHVCTGAARSVEAALGLRLGARAFRLTHNHHPRTYIDRNAKNPVQTNDWDTSAVWMDDCGRRARGRARCSGEGATHRATRQDTQPTGLPNFIISSFYSREAVKARPT